jgi:hypothetical protein
VIGVVVGLVAVAITVWGLVDLTRREVEHLPRWAWAAVIVLLSVVGVAAYVTLGRVPPGDDRPLVARLSRQEDSDAELMVWGMVIGMVVGTAVGQLALGMAVGLAVGAAADAWRARSHDG